MTVIKVLKTIDNLKIHKGETFLVDHFIRDLQKNELTSAVIRDYRQPNKSNDYLCWVLHDGEYVILQESDYK